MTNDRGYLSDMRECIDRIEACTRDGRDAFMASTLIQDGVVRNIVRRA